MKNSESKISQRQFKYNAATRSNWDSFESHRRHTTTAICDAKKHLPLNRDDFSIAILGCGNGNDIDLSVIANSFAKIHLFDFDQASLDHLSSRLPNDPAVTSKVIIEPPVDLTGIAADFDDLSSEPNETEVTELLTKARHVGNVLPDQSFDVVASTSLLTQLLASAVHAFGDDSKYKNAMMLAIRDGHLKLMADLLKPSGAGILVTDFVSSDTLPELSQTGLADASDSADAILQVARKAISTRNFFTGTNPWAVKDALAKLIVEDPFAPWTIAPPWRWQLGKDRSYLVTAISFSKPPGS